MRPRALALAALASVLAACGPTRPTGTSTPVARSCSERVAAMRARLASVPPHFWHIDPGGLGLPSSSAPDVVPELLPAARLAADGSTSLDGQPADLEQVAESLERLRRSWSILYPRRPYPGAVVIWADRRAHVDALRALADQLAPDDVLLAVRGTQPPSPACPAELGATCAELSVAAGGERAAASSRALQRAIGTCREAIVAWGPAAGMDARDRDRVFREDMPAAIAACGCEGVQLDAAEHVLLVIVGAMDPPVRMIALPEIAADDLGRTIEEWLGDGGGASEEAREGR